MTESNTHSNEPTAQPAAPSQATDAAEPAEPAVPTLTGPTDPAGPAGQAEPEMLGAPRPEDPTSAEKDPDDWVTGQEPMTGAQRSYLDTLARQAGEQISPDLTKAEASEHIERLQVRTGRGDA